MRLYRPLFYANLLTLRKYSVSKAALKYENFIIIGDFIIDINSSGVEL